MKHLLWIDPGMSTGITLGRFPYDDSYGFGAYELVGAWQITGGLTGFRDWWNRWDSWHDVHKFLNDEAVIGCEKFTPRPNKKGGGLPLKVVEPLRIEGWLVGEGILPDYPVEPGTPKPDVWQQPADQYFAGGKDQPEKKKRQHAWLKEHGLYVTGKDVGQPNADDARSAIAHSIAFLRGRQHRPTLLKYFR